MGSTSLLLPIVCEKFWIIVSHYTKSSKTVPLKLDVYEWLITCFHYCNTFAAKNNSNIDNNGVATIMKMKPKEINDDGNMDTEKDEDIHTSKTTIVDNNLRKFIMNELLQWIIMHTSTLSVIY